MVEGLRIIQPAGMAPGELWRACATPEGLQGWQADSVEGQVEPGALLRLTWPGLGTRLEVEVVDLQAPKLVVLRAGPQRVVIEVERGRIVVTHFGSSTEDEAAGISSGWRVSLATLAHWLEHHPRSPRHVHWAVCVAPASPELAHAYFTNGHALAAWLTHQGKLGEKDSLVRLGLRWGATLTGEVLANTPGRDVAVSWQEQDHSVLALRTLPLPGDSERRLLALQWSSWGKLAGRRDTASCLDSCVQRLAKVIGQRGAA